MAETKELNTRTQGKVIQLDYDFITSLEGVCSYCLTDSEVQMILGTSDYFGWSTRWYSESGEIDLETIRNLQGGLLKKLMNGCCCGDSPIRYRYTEDGILEQSTDDGETWEESPQNDPRNNSTIYPPIDEAIEDIKCVAAESGMIAVKEQVGEQLTDDMSRFTLDELIKTWVDTYIQTSNPFTAIITIAVNQIFALLIATLRPALTDTVYELFKCILYCNMALDASFDNAQWTAVRSDITAQIGGIAGIFLEHLVYLLGKVGLTNIVRSGLATSGDCSECSECIACGTNWHVRPDITTFTEIIDVGDDYVTVSAHGIIGSNYYGIIESGDIDSCCTFDSFEVLSGSVELWSGIECGSSTPFTGLVTGHCIHNLAPQSSVPFVVKLFFTDCP